MCCAQNVQNTLHAKYISITKSKLFYWLYNTMDITVINFPNAVSIETVQFTY